MAEETLNIRSIVNKLDDLLELRRDRSIDVLCLVETWHDADSNFSSPSEKRLPSRRSSSSKDIKSRRPIATNDDGVALIAAPGVDLASVAVVHYLPTSFEMTCARLTSGQFSGIVVVICRPGSVAVLSTLFDELAAVFDGFATHHEPIFVSETSTYVSKEVTTRMQDN
jgi:hypothetical protein